MSRNAPSATPAIFAKRSAICAFLAAGPRRRLGVGERLSQPATGRRTRAPGARQSLRHLLQSGRAGGHRGHADRARRNARLPARDLQSCCVGALDAHVARRPDVRRGQYRRGERVQCAGDSLPRRGQRFRLQVLLRRSRRVRAVRRRGQLGQARLLRRQPRGARSGRRPTAFRGGQRRPEIALCNHRPRVSTARRRSLARPLRQHHLLQHQPRPGSRRER